MVQKQSRGAYLAYRKALFGRWKQDFLLWLREGLIGEGAVTLAGVVAGVVLAFELGPVRAQEAAVAGLVAGLATLGAYLLLMALWYASHAPFKLCAADRTRLAALSARPGIALEEREQVRVIVPAKESVGSRAYLVFPDVCITNRDSQHAVNLEFELWLSYRAQQYIVFQAESGPIDGWETRKLEKGIPGRQPLSEPLNLPPVSSVAGYVSFHIYSVKSVFDEDAGWTDAEAVTAQLVIRDRLSGAELSGREYSMPIGGFRKDL